MADRKYKITFQMSDGTEKSVEFTAPQGDPGKSAYAYAQEAGYTGTEEEFAKELAGGDSTFDPTVYGLPILCLTGDTTGMSKDNAVSLDYVYGERSGTATVKWQGASSLAYPKKNYAIQFDNAFEAVDGWGEQEKYCLKANFIDHSHARNVVSAKLWGEIVKSRPTGKTVKVFTYDSSTKEKTYHDTAYTYDDGVITANVNNSNNGSYYITSVPHGGFSVTCDVLFPEGAENLNLLVKYVRADTNVSNFITKTASSAGVWETITFSTVWAEGSETLVAIMATATNGVKFRNIRIDGTGSNAGKTYYIPDNNPADKLKPLINGGAVDGFPCIVMLNGEFHGLYTFNIPKDGWMFGMNDSSTPQAILCADTQNEACGFKALATLTDDFDLEYVSDENNSAWVLASLNTLISTVMNSDGTNLDTIVAKYLDWQSAIDYMIFTVLLGGQDMYRKNYLLVTYDGTKWFFSAYDMDSTYGIHWSGEKFLSMNAYPTLKGYNHRVMELIYTYKKDELLARYEEIRNTVMSEDNVYQKFTNFTSAIPSPVLVEDVKLWPTIPSSSASNTAQILNWYRLRSMFIDKEAESIT